MKILHLSKPWFSVPPIGYGGVERQIYSLILNQIKSHEVHLFASGDSKVDAAIHLHATFAQSLHGMGYDRTAECIQALDFFRYAYSDPAAIVHVHSVEPYLVHAPMLPRKTVFSFYNQPNRATEQLTSMTQENVAFVFLSKQHRSDFPWTKNGAVVYPGLQTEAFPFLAHKESYLAFVGSIADKKGIIEAIEISKLSKMPLKIAAKVKDPDREFFKHEAEPLIKQSPHVEFLGEVDDKTRNNVLAKASAMLFPIKWNEPFGNVLTECMVVGTPVIAFERGSVPELIIDSKTGFIVNTVRQAADAVKKLDTISPYDCRQHVVDNFSAIKAAHDYQQLYASL